MKLSVQFAALALLLSSSAAARSVRRTFQVGAVVVASATVSSTLKTAGARNGIEVRIIGRRARAAAIFDGAEVRVIEDGRRSTLAALAGGDTVVTVLY